MTRKEGTRTKPPSGEPAAAHSGLAIAAPQPEELEQHEVLVRPSAQNARVMQAWGRVGEVDLSALGKALQDKSRAVVGGNLDSVKALLFDQSLALQAIFTNLSIEAAKSQTLGRMEPLLRLALKAQSQSRATLETLAVITNPPVVYAKQANIAAGHQQVNIGTSQAHAPAVDSPPTKLFEGGPYGNGLDTGAPCAPGRVDSQLEAVGAVDRSPHRGGQRANQEQPVPRRRASAAAPNDARPARGTGQAAKRA